MIHIQDRLVFKSNICDVTVLVLCHTVVVLLLTQSCGGQPHLIGSPQPIVVMVGDDVILPCQLEPAADAVDLAVEWARPDLDPRFVYLRRDGEELLIQQNPSYVGRTSLTDVNKLKCGDISLRISEVKLSDAGSYRCLVPKYASDHVTELVVGSVSSPDIKISKSSSGVVLECECKGWYPEPEVLWLDGEGNVLSAGPTETVRGPDDLYTVSSRVTVDKRHGNTFTCRVQHTNINQMRETHIHVSDEFFTSGDSSAARITISLVVCFICVLIIAFVVWKMKRNKMHDKEERSKNVNSIFEHQVLTEGEREHLMTDSEKVTYLKKTKANLHERISKNNEELQHVEHVIISLTKQKKDLKNQRETLNQVLQTMKTQIEEKNKEQQEVTFKIKTDKQKDKLKNTKEDLEKRKTDCDDLIKATEKLLESTERLINKMTERKGKLVNEKEQLEKHIRDTETQREMIQKKCDVERQRETEMEKNLESEHLEIEQEPQNESPEDPVRPTINNK